MPRALAPALLLALGLSACAGPGLARRPRVDDLPERLARRAAALVGHRTAFEAGGARFAGDCIGFVQAVYEAEGIPLRALQARVAPREISGVFAAYRVADAHGILFGGGGARPRPGDLVFFHDTYDRNRNGQVDDSFTHIGIVESVRGGSVTFLHRGGDAVVRATLDLDRPGVPRDRDGAVVNSYVRAKRSGPVPGTQGLAGELFAGFGRIDLERLPELPGR